jgi:hypothetical protein
MRTRICLFLSGAVQAELPRGRDAAANRSPPLFLASVFYNFLGEIPSNFDLRNVISAYKKDFSWTNGPNSPDFQQKK